MRGAISNGSKTYDWPQDGADSPSGRDQSDVERALFRSSDDTKKGQGANVDAATTNASNHAPNYEGVHIRSSTRDGSANLKSDYIAELEPLDVENPVHLRLDEY